MAEHVEGCNEEACPARGDGIHCRCWFDAGPCCACGAPECPACLEESNEGGALDEKGGTDAQG